MAYENVRFTAPNMSGDSANSYFYNVAGGVLYQKNKVTGSIVSIFPPNAPLGTVSSLQFDGIYYWTLERQTGGVLIRKWEILNGILYQRSIFSYVSDAMIEYDSYSFSVDNISTTLSAVGYIGSTSISVVDTSEFNVGDSIVLGPSTYTGYLDKIQTNTILSKSATTISLSTPLGYTFDSGDSIYCSRYFYLFNKYAPFDSSRGSLLRFRVLDGTLSSFSAGSVFGDVVASCFYNGKIMFVKGNEVISLNSGSMVVYKHMALDNLGVDRGETISTYALFAHSDILYCLRDRYVYYDGDWDTWEEEVWSSQYNFVSSSLLPVVYFIEVKASPDIIHVVSSPVIPTSTSNISVSVLDQYRVPLPGKTVSFASTQGTVVPSTGVTDSNGELTAVYNGTINEAKVEITATVA